MTKTRAFLTIYDTKLREITRKTTNIFRVNPHFTKSKVIIGKLHKVQRKLEIRVFTKFSKTEKFKN